jgi:hypothetical protein
MIKLFFYITVLCLVTACNQLSSNSANNLDTQSSKNHEFVLTVTGGKTILTISVQEYVEDVKRIISNKKPLLRKILPLFKTQLTLKSADTKQVWLVAKPNYIKLKSSQSTQIYTVMIKDKNNDFFELLTAYSDK